MRSFKKAKTPALRSSTDGTTTWKDMTKNKPRKIQFRDSMVDRKAAYEKGNIYEAQMLPEMEEDEDEDDLSEGELEVRERDIENEWVAENLVDFFYELFMLHNIMVGSNDEWDKGQLENDGFPENMRYLWKEHNDRPAVEVTAGKYCHKVLHWIEKRVHNEDIFPTNGDAFRWDFVDRYAKKMFQRMFRVFAIMVINPTMSGIGKKHETEEAKLLKSLFARFLCFVWYWDLVKEREINCIEAYTEPIKRQYEAAEEKYHREAEEYEDDNYDDDEY